MKKLILPILIAFAFASCEERNELINLEAGEIIYIDSTDQTSNPPAPQKRVVYIEEFTGVKCKNCPKAHEELYRLQDANDGQLISAALHIQNVFYTVPFDKSKMDFRTLAATQISSITGVPASFPMGNVNRKVFSGTQSMMLTYQQWGGRVSEELAEATAANIEVAGKKFDEGSRELTVSYKVTFLKDLSIPVNFSVLLTESGIMDLQEDNVHIDSTYIHNNVLRKCVDVYTGKKLGETVKAGAIYYLHFTTVLNKDWNPEKMNVISFLSNSSSTEKQVLQANQTKVN